MLPKPFNISFVETHQSGEEAAWASFETTAATWVDELIRRRNLSPLLLGCNAVWVACGVTSRQSHVTRRWFCRYVTFGVASYERCANQCAPFLPLLYIAHNLSLLLPNLESTMKRKRRRSSQGSSQAPAKKKAALAVEKESEAPRVEETKVEDPTPIPEKEEEKPTSKKDGLPSPGTIQDVAANHDKLLASFLELLEAIESSTPSDAKDSLQKATLTLLELKQTQRKLFQYKASVHRALQEKRTLLLQREMILSNGLYEKQFLQHQEASFRNYPTNHLEKLCRQELEGEEEDPIKKYIGYSLENPENHGAILQKLHGEIHDRGTLERNVQQLQKSLRSQHQASAQRRQFLQELPKKLDILERASLPLQKFFQANSKGMKMLGTSDRSKRLHLASSHLKAPLYTLFCQLQSYIDHEPTELSLEVFNQSKLHLHVPIPDVCQTSSNKTKRVTVEFSYLADHSVVTAKATGPSDKIQASSLLTELFPDDDGKFWVIPSDQLLLTNGDEDDEKKRPSRKKKQQQAALRKKRDEPAKPYHWCNYIAGIHMPASSNTYPSTRAVIQALLGRVESNATLTQVLHWLEKKKTVPQQANVAARPNVVTKLHGFAGSSTTNTYTVTLKRQQNTVQASVQVDPVRYPTVPPVWTIPSVADAKDTQNDLVESLQSCSNQLYDPIGSLELQINSLEGIEEGEWVLVHQLEGFKNLWDQLHVVANASSRSRKGRDRSHRVNG